MRLWPAAGVGLLGVLAACSATTVRASHPTVGSSDAYRASAASASAPSTSPAALPAAGQVVRTLPFPVGDTELFAASGSELDVAVISAGNQAHTITVERVSATTGGVSQTSVPFPLASYLSDVAVGPDGVYLGTSVVQRFTAAPDVLARLDPTTLTITAQASFPARVQVLAEGTKVWASIGNGRVVRLDPRSLTVQQSVQIPPGQQATTVIDSAPALGLGSLWVLAGDETDLRLIRLNPTTLTILSTTPVPTGGALSQSLYAVTADAQLVYLTGRGVARVDAGGALAGPPQISAGLHAVAIHGNGLVAITNPPAALVLLGGDGRTAARTALADAGGQLAVSGDTAWLLGDAGQGNGIVQLRLATAVPAG